MKVEYKDNKRVYSFSVMSCGEVFKYDENYYMRCSPDDDNLTINAVNIETGYITHILRDTKVEKIEGKFIVD